jgi:hypothetical protein
MARIAFRRTSTISQKYFQDQSSTLTWSLLRWRYHGIFMKVGGEDESKNHSSDRNKSMRSYYEKWPFGRIHMSRFL